MRPRQARRRRDKIGELFKDGTIDALADALRNFWFHVIHLTEAVRLIGFGDDMNIASISSVAKMNNAADPDRVEIGGWETAATAFVNKAPEITLMFWVIKIAATTLGETGGDAFSMSLNLGYAISSLIFIAVFVVGVSAQIAAKSFYPSLYWVVVVATTTLGTTMADFADRSLGIGYAGGATILFALLMASLAVWYWVEKSVSVDAISSPRTQVFYWATILFSQTLGTALGDWMADNTGLGYKGGALVFAAALAGVAICYFYTRVSHTLLFWTAFILTRPLGATVGDLLDKPVENGGFALSRFYASAILAAFIVLCILITHRKQRRS